jgi:RNA polymerase sigma-70 factor (ECF subfamily)
MTTFSELPEDTLRLCKAGNLTAIKVFIKHYERPVHYFLWSRLGEGPHVDDLAQETFVRAIRALPSLDLSRNEKIWSWLRTIALNLARDWRRKKANSELPFNYVDELLSPTTPEQEALLIELGNKIEYAIKELDPLSWSIFELAVLDDKSNNEIADRLNIPVGTVKSRLSRARELLRKLLDDWSGWVP